VKFAPSASSTVLASPIRLSVLGGFGIVGLRGVVDRAGEKRAHVRALLAIVGTSNEGVHRDELLEALWPRLSEQAGRNRLYHTMHLARQSLSELAWPDKWLALSGGRVQLDPRVHCDARELIAAAHGSPAQLEDSALLDFIDESSGEWAPDVEAGSLGATLRAQVRASYAGLLHEAASRQERNADTPLRRRLLKRILRLNATDEWACAQLMQLDLDAGRPYAVLRAFEAASKALVEQLGLRPSARLSAIATQAAGALSHSPASQVAEREPGGLLLGREALVKRLVDALNAGPGIWNLVGLSGVGKTSLMREVSRRVGPSRADGVRFVSLGDAAADESATVATARLARLEDQGGLDAAERLKHFMGSRDALLVIDDLDAALDWRDLIEIAPSVLTTRVVWISYTPIESAACRLVPVPPLETAEVGASSARARESVAAMLFQMRRPSVDAVPPSDAEWELILRLVARLDGMPLAIELAAACTATMTPSEILQRIDQGAALVATGPAIVDKTAPRHRSIDAALTMSVGRLGSTARRAFLAAAVFSGRFTFEAFRAVASAVGITPAVSCEGALLELESAGLLVSADETGRFRMLHLPRAYARRRAAEEGVWSAIEQARIAQVVDGLERLACSVESTGYTAWMKSVRQLEDEVLPLLGSAAVSNEAMFIRLLRPMAHFWSLRTASEDVVGWLDRGARVARRLGDARYELELAVHAAGIKLQQFRYDEALSRTESARPLLDRVEDADAKTWWRCIHALVLSRLDRTDEADRLFLAGRTETPLGSVGYWTICARQWELGNLTGIDLPSGPDWPSYGALRTKLSGSRIWPILLYGAFAYSTHLNAESRLLIVEDMRIAGQASQWMRAVHTALRSKSIALLQLDRHAEGVACMVDAYQLASVAGSDYLAFSSGSCLVEFAWRSGELALASNWLTQTRNLVSQGVNAAFSYMQIQVDLHEIVLAVLGRDKARACAAYLAASGHDFARRGFDCGLIETETEIGALLARLLGMQDLAASLTQALGVMSHPMNNFPLADRFRQTHLGLDMSLFRSPRAARAVVGEAAQRAGLDLSELARRVSIAGSPSVCHD
jgi:DNA-binding SARP family transcriptional activator/predicted ATPase